MEVNIKKILDKARLEHFCDNDQCPRWSSSYDVHLDSERLGFDPLLRHRIFTGRNEVVAKVIFLHLSVILFTGGSASVHAGIPPIRSRPPWSRHHPPRNRHYPPRADTTPREQTPPPQTRHPTNPPTDQADPPRPGRHSPQTRHPTNPPPPPQTRQTPQTR